MIKTCSGRSDWAKTGKKPVYTTVITVFTLFKGWKCGSAHSFAV